MKRIIGFVLIGIIVFSMIGCSSNKITTITEGSYTLKTKEDFAICPSVTILDKTFTFTFDSLSSYFNHGTYAIENGILILKTDDDKYEYQFEIKNQTLVFQEKKSSSVKLIDKKIGVQIVDGDVFELVNLH